MIREVMQVVAKLCWNRPSGTKIGTLHCIALHCIALHCIVSHYYRRAVWRLRLAWGAQVMEEGERLSKKQSSMEGTIKKLRQQIRDLEATQSQAASKLAGEESKLEAAVKARQQAEASLAASLQQHKAEADQQKQQYEALLARARSSQVCHASSHHATGPIISSSLPPPLSSCHAHSHRAMLPLISPSLQAKPQLAGLMQV